MTYFDQILAARGYTDCPLPLWRLKVTGEEYLELRNFLVETWDKYHSFRSCPRDAALYMAEWWKRDPDISEESGVENRVFLSLGLDHNEAAKEDFIKNAQRVMDERDKAYLGFKPLVIRHRSNNEKTKRKREYTTYYDYTLFYQGGFPMGKACSGRMNNKWSVCIPKFTRTNFSLGDLPGSVIASRLLEEYKDVLVSAAREKRPDKMPFHCDSDKHDWYQFALKGVETGLKELEGRPFRISWCLDLGRNNAGVLSYVIHGNAELKEGFLQSRRAWHLDGITLQLFEDEVFVRNIAEYASFESKSKRSFVSFADVYCKSPYNGSSQVSIRIAETGETLYSSSFDLDVPHTFFWDGISFSAGARFGTRRSLILFKEPWTAEEIPEGCSVKQFTIDDVGYSLIDNRPEENGSYFALRNSMTNDLFEAGAEAALPSWTEVDIAPSKSPFLLGKVADFTDANAFSVSRCTPDEEKEVLKEGDYYFREANGGEWSSYPPLGVISCAIKYRFQGKEMMSFPENHLVNVGPGFSIKRKTSRPTETHFILSWDGGDVFIDSPDVQRDGERWICRKEFFPHLIPLHFIPKEGQGKPFDLNLRAAYRETVVTDNNGRPIGNGEIIPVAQLSEYRYKLTDIPEFYLRWDGGSNKIPVSNNSEDWGRGAIPEEGPLSIPISPTVLNAVKDNLDKGCHIDFRTIQFDVQEYPLALTLIPEERAFKLSLRAPFVWDIEDWNQNEERLLDCFQGWVLMSALADGIHTEIHRDSDGRYRIPEDLSGDYVVALSLRGYMRPFIINTEGGSISTIDLAAEKDKLSSVALNTGEWLAAARFMDVGLKYSLNLSMLPWIGTIINDGLLLALFVFQKLSNDWLNLSTEDILLARIRISLRDALLPFHGIEDKEEFESLVRSLARREDFDKGYFEWKREQTETTDKEEFGQFLEKAIERTLSFMDKIAE